MIEILFSLIGVKNRSGTVNIYMKRACGQRDNKFFSLKLIDI